MAKRKLTDQQIDELCSLYQQNVSWVELCRRFKITDACIMACLDLRKIPRRKNYGKGSCKLPDEQITTLCNEYCQGIERKDICRRYGIDEGTLSKYLKSRGVPLRGPKSKLTETDLDALCNDYSAGMEWEAIAIKHGVNTSNIVRYLNNRNIPRRQNRTPNRYSDSQMQMIYKEYSEGDHPDDLCDRYSISLATLYKYLGIGNVRLRHHSSEECRYFKVIDSEEKAYWLGFIAADGCVVKKKLMLNLARKDEAHLERLRDVLDPCRRIYRLSSKIKGKEYPQSRLHVVSSNLVSDLEALGVHERKTFTLEFPELEDWLVRHFIRGYADGDGCWSVDRYGISFSVIGTVCFIKEMQQILMKHCLLQQTKMDARKSKTRLIGVLRYGGNRQCIRIANYLYNDAAVFLPRKRNIVLDHYNTLPQYQRLPTFG